MEELRESAIVKSLSKRSNITLCPHGINKSYCTICAAKKPAKSTRAKKGAAAADAPAETVAEKPAE